MRQAEEYLDELEFLARNSRHPGGETLHAAASAAVVAHLRGPGKLEEIVTYCKEEEIDVVIFDDELTPSQTRNIEKEIAVPVAGPHASDPGHLPLAGPDGYAKTQVQLANYEYMLPRLSGLWTHLERQSGGTGTRGGAGEREIETDRRIIRNRIAKLEGGPQEDRPSDGRAAFEPRVAGACGAGRLYERRGNRR